MTTVRTTSSPLFSHSHISHGSFSKPVLMTRKKGENPILLFRRRTGETVCVSHLASSLRPSKVAVVSPQAGKLLSGRQAQKVRMHPSSSKIWQQTILSPPQLTEFWSEKGCRSVEEVQCVEKSLKGKAKVFQARCGHREGEASQRATRLYQKWMRLAFFHGSGKQLPPEGNVLTSTEAVVRSYVRQQAGSFNQMISSKQEQLGNMQTRISQIGQKLETHMHTWHDLQNHPQKKEELRRIEGDILTLCRELDGIWEERARLWGKQADELATYMRMAILVHWAEHKGGAFETYDPSQSRAEIEGILQDWGLDIQYLAPEIGCALASANTKDTILLWRAQTYIDPEYQEARHKGVSVWQRLYRWGIAMKRPLSHEERAGISAILDSLSEGSKWDLRAGTRMMADTQRLALDPTGTAYFRLRLGGAKMDQVEIEASSKGRYFVHLRGGYKGSLGLSGGAYQGFGGIASVDASLDATMERSQLQGVSLIFEKENLLTFFDRLLTSSSDVTLSHIEDIVDEVAFTHEIIKTGNVGVRGYVGVGTPHFLEDPVTGGKKIALRAEAGVKASKKCKYVQIANNRWSRRKTEEENSFTAGGSMGLYATPVSHLDPAFTGNILTLPLYQHGKEKTFSKTRKADQDYDKDGTCTKARFRDLACGVRPDIPKGCEKAIESLMPQMGEGIQITYEMPADKLKTYNELRKSDVATANSFLEDRNNYQAASASRYLTLRESKENGLNLGFLQVGNTASSSLERILETVNLPKAAGVASPKTSS